jgi:hypothetical protein
MEIYALALSFPAALVASVPYCLLLTYIVAKWNAVRLWLFVASTAVLCLFAAEIILLATLGAVQSYSLLGPGFYDVHLVLFVLGIPALANFLLLGRFMGFLGKWYVAAPLCAICAVPLAILQYAVTEDLFAIYGMGGPF